jgi:uncharacterized repeat protein (TIGR01451 family)
MKPLTLNARMKRILSQILLVIAMVSLLTVSAEGQELPRPSANLQVIPAGSLVIPMDNAKQNEGALFNIRAYGLVNNFLQNDIPAKWVIRSGKLKDGVDFTARASRIAPTALAAASLDFAGGPFIVDRAYADQARARIAAFNAAAPTRRVHVYELTEDVTVDVRYELFFKPQPFVNSTNASIATGILDLAGITNYTVGGNAAITGNACYTILLEPHNTNISAASSIRTFLQGGGNFYAQCASVAAFENDSFWGRYLTVGGTTGLTTSNTGNVDIYPNPDLPFSQFIGAINHAPGGSEYDWRLSTGASFQSHAHAHAQATGFSASAQPYAAMVGKVRSGMGGVVFYMGGHDHKGTSLGNLNLQRMMLNAVLTPAERPSICNIVISVPDLSVTKTHTGTFYVDSVPAYVVRVRNGGNAATVAALVVTDTLPPGISYQSASGTGWTFAVSGQVVTATFNNILPAGGVAELVIRVGVGVAAIGTVTNRVWVETSGEVNRSNNGAVHTTTAFGQPRLTLAKTAATDSVNAKGTFLTYTISFSNAGTASALSTVVTDSLPGQIDFVIGSVRSTLPADVQAVIEYSVNGSSWDYLPASGGCGAPPGMDACIKQIRWRFLHPFSHVDPENTGTALLSARIR